MGDGDQLGVGTEHLFVLVHEQFSGVVNGHDPQIGSLFLAQHLPGNDVGVVLHVGDDDVVAGAYVLPPVGVSHQVDPFRGVPSVNYLFVVAGIDELPDLGSCALITISRLLAHGMDAAVHIGVGSGVVIDDGINHGLGFL